MSLLIIDESGDDLGGSARYVIGAWRVVLLAVRWYLRYNLSYRDLEELLAERVEVGHVTLFRRVQRFTPLLVEAARSCRHLVGDRWFVDETYVRVVAGVWRYVYRAVDQYGQVIDVLVRRAQDAGGSLRDVICAHGLRNQISGSWPAAV